MASWTARDIPDLTGTHAVVTGANSGLGVPTALELTRHGASVVMAARDPAKGRAAVREVRERVPGAEVEYGRLDLADLGSVREFADSVTRPLGILVNNAGIAVSARRRTTADGFELLFGVNHLGHFALTGLLLPRLLAHPGARVVTVSSDQHAAGRIDFDDLGMERSYAATRAYARSKLANLMFALELNRRAEAAGADLRSLATHPGFTATNIARVGPLTRPLAALLRLIAQPTEVGALTSLYAATSPDAHGGDFIGPGLRPLQPSPAPTTPKPPAASGRSPPT
ncbi:oxidoreductase [Thermocatellispora tengchongensis]|uniref:oxidoreductase n=1 Tax=Thermocatellispora tengchongensis TaxID=1073253 RepID=UPI003640BFB4